MPAQPLYKLRDGLLALTYPQMCRLCDAPVESWDDGVVCAACWENPQVTRIFFNQAGCEKCGIPLASNPNALPSENQTASCESCKKMRFTYARSCGAYAGALEANVLFLKSQPHICRRLRQLLHQTFATNQKVFQSDVVMPVPLHHERERQRGFNQAALIAKLLARDFALRLDCDSLQRIKYAEKHRIGMDAIDRARSVAKAFQVTDAQKIAGASVLLIDDVLTTGSTTNEVTETLLDAGAAHVKVLTVARVMSQHR